MRQRPSGSGSYRPIVEASKGIGILFGSDFWESKGLPANVKVDIILANEKRLLESQRLLRQVKDKRTILDQPSLLQDVPNHEPKLVELSKVHIEQEERAEDLDESTLALIGQYNDLINTITETFVRYDELLSAAEEVKQTNKR